MKYKNLTGQRFGRLTALKYMGTNRSYRALWLCKCTCGQEKIVNSNSLLMGTTRSCGCLNNEQRHKKGVEANRAKHGLHGTRLYRIWKQIKTRCCNPNTTDWKDYGGRGITICAEWENNFSNFYNWALENNYDDTKSIDRIDVNGNYEPSNCKWETMKHQANNKRSNHFITIDGETKTCAEWIETSGICHSTFYQRLRNGKTGRELILPPRSKKGVHCH